MSHYLLYWHNAILPFTTSVVYTLTMGYTDHNKYIRSKSAAQASWICFDPWIPYGLNYWYCNDYILPSSFFKAIVQFLNDYKMQVLSHVDLHVTTISQ